MGNCSACFKSSENSSVVVQDEDTQNNQTQQGSVHNIGSAGTQQTVAGNTVISSKNEQGEVTWLDRFFCVLNRKFSFRELPTPIRS